MGRPRQITDEQILETTRACVLEVGPQVSLDTVAERLGVTSPALLKRFGSRQALFLASLKPPSELPFRPALERGPDPALPFEEQLEAMFSTVLDFFTEMVPRFSALRESGLSHNQVHQLKTGPASLIHLMARWLDRAVEEKLIDSDATESAATAMVGALTTRAFTAHWTNHRYSSRSNREYLRDVTRLFCRALSTSAAERRQEKPGGRGRSPPSKS